MQPRALIVDDEAPAREELRFLLEETSAVGDSDRSSRVQVVGEATNGQEALVLLKSLDYDLVFLDIRMPGLSGLDVAKELHSLEHHPQIIFTTAYPDHAVEAFDLAAADYLVKPFDAERLSRAVQRALGSAPERQNGSPEEHLATTARTEAEPTIATQQDQLRQGVALRQGGTSPARRTPTDSGTSVEHRGSAEDISPRRVAEPERLIRIPVQRDGRTVLVEGDAIVYAAAARGYSSLKLVDDKLLVSFSLNELQRRLQGHFFRVHRAYLVNLRYVRELVPDFKGSLVLVMNDRQRSRVEVSRRHARELRKRLGV